MIKNTLIVLIIALLSSAKLFGAEISPHWCRCQPNEPCWPSASEWQSLGKELSGKLVKPQLPLEPCKKNQTDSACIKRLEQIRNPFFLQQEPGFSQSQGWFNAWHLQASPYAVEAQSAADIAAAINFARDHHLRVVIKGAGHDYLGRSNAPNSLLIWTGKMRGVKMANAFVPEGCPAKTRPVPAVTVNAGARWIDVYNEVTTRHNRYVQGGGCTTVGAVGGFIQGGGFGSFSKKFGTGAAGILQAEVVTADGKILVANACQNQDLFWAIRGGGGGTFGVVTQMTLLTHQLPDTVAVVQGKITATNDLAYQLLIKQFLLFFREHLSDEHWGEQFALNPDNSLTIMMLAQGLDEAQVKKIWEPLTQWVHAQPKQFYMEFNIITAPMRKLWDFNYLQKNHPQLFVPNDLKDAKPGEFWWPGNSGEVFHYWFTYQSRFLPLKLFDNENIDKLSQVLFKASRLSHASFHLNKGLANASPDALYREKHTSVNPAVSEAAMLVIMGQGAKDAYFDLDGHEPDKARAEKAIKNINGAMQLITELTPNSGAYLNEADYFQKNWQQDFWGKNYSRLLQIKKKYDPQGLFYCHHCVGSEFWSDDGMCKARDNKK